MARERFVNRVTLFEGATGLFFVVIFGSMVWLRYLPPTSGWLHIGSPDPSDVLLVFFLAAVVFTLVQSQWVAVGATDLVARVWPLLQKVPLAGLRLGVWGKDKRLRGLVDAKIRKDNGAIWLTHEGQDGMLVVSKVFPGPPGPFLARLAEVAPRFRLLPTGRGAADAKEERQVGRREFAGRPAVCTSDNAAIFVFGCLMPLGAWYVALASSWLIGVPIILAALWLVWGATHPVVVLDDRGVSVPVATGTRLLPWGSILGVAVGRGRVWSGGPQVFIWSGSEVPEWSPVSERSPKSLVSVGVLDTRGLYEQVVAAAGLEVEGDIAYRA